ncbi:MAG: hypothetical protein GY760_14090 [Deltaproteobacteria bacterium]|nr:hypothetical protein [Deltaproteobacteria bacterium]
MPYKAINKETSNNKASYDVEVDLVQNRLPNESELKNIALEIKEDSGPVNNLFICFYLPGMKINAGAYATGHQCNIEIQEYMLLGTKYQRLI